MAAKRKVSKKVESATPVEVIDYSSTFSVQRWLSGLYGLQAIALLIASVPLLVPVTAVFLAQNSLSATDSAAVSAGVSQLFVVDIVHVLTGMLFVLALLALASVTLFQKVYQQSLERGTYQFRWITFVFGLSVSVLAILLLSGLQTISVLLLAGLASGVVALSFYYYQQRSVRRLTLIGGWVAAGLLAIILASVPMVSYFEDGSFPGYLYGVYAALFAYMVLVALLVIRSSKRDSIQERLRTERSLSLALFGVQSLLVWQIFLGALT